MESFAAVIRSLLVRIRAIQAAQANRHPGSCPPPATTGGQTFLYRVAPASWGVEPSAAADHRTDEPSNTGSPLGHASRRATPSSIRRRRRRRLDLTAYGLPVPRGLPAT